MTDVALAHCETYEPAEVERAVRHVVDLAGGISRFVKSGNRVLLKPNLLSARPPERRITTDPAVIGAVARLVREAGGKPFIGDSPALDPFKRVALKTGVAELAEKMGMEFMELSHPTAVKSPGGSLFRKLEIAGEALDADVVINLPKLKTHSQMLFTLGVKNLFGTIVAQRKAEWHYMTGLNRDTFASLHLDIYLTVRPAFTLLDGVWAMEGHGPSNGNPRRLGLIAAATDAVALDTAMCHLLGAPLQTFPLYRAALARGIGETNVQQIKFQGASVRHLALSNFKVPALDSLGVLPGLMDRFAGRYLVSKPVHAEQVCVGCGKCAEICPANAIEQTERHISFDYEQCIRCYCCQEICPEDAIHFKKGWIVKALNRFSR